MYNNLLKHCFPSSDISINEESTKILSSDTRIDLECKEFLPEVYDTWSFIHKLSTDTTHFHEIYNLYKYERSKTQQKYYFDQLKLLDETIYKLSVTIHQYIQTLEKLVQPVLDEYRISKLNTEERNNYTPAYIRIVENQLNSLKLAFKRIIIKHNSDSIDYQNDLKKSVENSKQILHSYQQLSPKNSFNTDEEQTSIISQQQVLTQEEKQIIDLEVRLESIRTLKDRVRQMNEITMALYFSVQEQNELTDNIWLNTSAGSDYIAQSLDEFRLVKNLKQSKMNLWIKLICITFCFLSILILILTFILILNQK